MKTFKVLIIMLICLFVYGCSRNETVSRSAMPRYDMLGNKIIEITRKVGE